TERALKRLQSRRLARQPHAVGRRSGRHRLGTVFAGTGASRARRSKLDGAGRHRTAIDLVGHHTLLIARSRWVTTAPDGTLALFGKTFSATSPRTTSTRGINAPLPPGHRR